MVEEELADLLSPGDETLSSEGGPLPPPPPPKEVEPPEGSRYLFVKRFSYDVLEYRLEDLKPDRFYDVQVLCETTGGQLGNWSNDNYMVTLAKIRIRADLIDEECVRLSWVREAPRRHPRLLAPMVAGTYSAQEFDFEAKSLDAATNPFEERHSFAKHEQGYKLEDLKMNSCYTVRIRSCDTQKRWSMWSDNLCFVTQNPMRVIPEKMTEHSAWVEWGRDEQVPTAYIATDRPLEISTTRANQYHLRVAAANDHSQKHRNTKSLCAVATFSVSGDRGVSASLSVRCLASTWSTRGSGSTTSASSGIVRERRNLRVSQS